MSNVTTSDQNFTYYRDSDAYTSHPATNSFLNENGIKIEDRDNYSFWETLIDPKKLFPHLDPLAAIIVYVSIVLLLALFLLLLIWIISVWCLEVKAKKKKRRKQQSDLLIRDLFSHSMSPFGSVGSLSTLTSASYGHNSLSHLVNSKNYDKKEGNPQHYCTQSSKLRPLSCGASRCPSCTSFDRSKKQKSKKAKAQSEKSQLLRNYSMYQQNHTMALQRNPSYLSSTSSFRDGLCKNCYAETCFGRACELPRANWDGDRILNFIRDQTLKTKNETPSSDYGILTETYHPSTDQKANLSNSSTIKVDTTDWDSSKPTEDGKAYSSEFPPPPL